MFNGKKYLSISIIDYFPLKIEVFGKIFAYQFKISAAISFNKLKNSSYAFKRLIELAEFYVSHQ